ncbi:MAG: C4-dicarboxylate ABC transporter permease, partial [Litoreibacter sp.]|nr:C4-dicarboxylate ABC transporter permease [Litoreibacter sp.]
IEDYISGQFDENGTQIMAAIDKAAGLDVSYLPDGLQKDFGEGLEKARSSFALMEEIESVQVQLEEGALAYRPQHRIVRALQRDARSIDHHIEEIELRVSRKIGDIEAQERELEELKAEREALLSQIPETWEGVQGEYAKITSADRKARSTYRRTVDQAYEPIIELRELLAGTEGLAPLEAPILELAADAASMDRDTAETRFKEVERLVGEVNGAGDIRSLLSKARRNIDSRKQDYDKAAENIEKALETLRTEITWRTRASAELTSALEEYNEAIRDTIGLRKQDKLPREQALFVASCSSGHRDISLNF